MDLSKLPRLSKTDAPPAPDAAASEPAPPGARGFDPVLTTSAPAAGYCRCGAPLRLGARFCDSCGAPVDPGVSPPVASYASAPIRTDVGVGAEVWLSAIIGAVLMLIGKSFGGWLIAAMTGRAYDTGATWAVGERTGQPVAYWDLEGYAALNDSAIFLFGFAMVLEALVLALLNTRFRHKVGLVTTALVITVAATALNLFATAKLLSANVMPLWSLLAVGFGGYIAVFEWRLLQQLRPPARA
jgi:hypothetical protein